MSTPLTKSKEKRPRSPSESNNSFVKNVTSRVSGLLPATIAKWFSTSSSNTNGSAQVTEASDSSTEDEAPENPITTQPPAKKFRYASPGEFNPQGPVETKCIGTNTESVEEPYTGHSSIGRGNGRMDNILTPTLLHSASNDTTEGTAQEIIFKPQHSISAVEHLPDKKRRCLFRSSQNDSYKNNNYSGSGSDNIRDPHFKPSLLSSPFYVGRTMYGGASSSSITPGFKRKAISLTNETPTDDSVTMSHSARRVMDLLEHYSSPLIEAKRIPQTTRDPEKDSLGNLFQQSVNPYKSNVRSYKTQELHVPSIASILTIKRKSRLMDSTNAARQIIASHSSSSKFSLYSNTSSGGDPPDELSGDILTTKMKSKLTRTNRERNIEMENNSSETVNLPNVILQIDKNNLPKFTFGPTSTSQSTTSSSIQTPVIITPEALKKNIESDILKLKNVEKDKPLQVDNDNYKFTNPVSITSESNKTSLTPPKFNFEIPESSLEKDNEVKTKDDHLHISNNQTVLDSKLLVQKSSDWKCLDCWVNNKVDVTKCICCGGKKPVDINDSKKCSVCNISIKQSQYDKCTECEKKTNIIEKPFVAKEENNIKWKCNDCWVDNKESADKCVCCGAKNPKKTPPVGVIKSEKSIESEWKCDGCWIINENSLTKCMACGKTKPRSQAKTYVFGNSSLPKNILGDNKVKDKEISDSTFKSIAQSQSEKWECPVCLARNDPSRESCICCEAGKPGMEKESQSKFSFHQASEITFKFGIQHKSQESHSDIEPEECNMGEESETNNNVLPKTSIISFGLPVNKFDVQSGSMNTKHLEAPKIKFTFGVPKDDQMPTRPIRSTIFGIQAKPTELSKVVEENPQEVSQVYTSPQLNEPLKTNVGLFNTSVTSQVAPEMPAIVPLHALNQDSGVNKNVTFLSSPIIPSTTSEGKTQQNNFKFSSIMPGSNLFSTEPTSTTAISNIVPASASMSVPTSSPISIFLKANTVTTTTSSYFQKSESLPTLGGSLFSKTESTTATSPVSASGTMQPLFSFVGQGSVPQPEKPKFSFNFSSTKTDPGLIFKPAAFGGSTDNNMSSNTFQLPSNSIIGGNPLNTAAQMNTANTLTTGNSLTTPSGSSIFGATVPKENMWSQSTNNIFATNTTTNGDQKPPAFTFGTSPFSANNAPFGNTTQSAQANNAPFGNTTQSAQANNAPFGNTTQSAQANNAPFGNTTQSAQPNNAPFGNTTQSAQANNAPFGNTTQSAQPNNAPFGSTAPQAQASNAPFCSTAPQGHSSNAPFGSNAQQAQSNNSPFGSTTQQVQPNNVPFGSTVQQTQPNNDPFGSSVQQPNNSPFSTTVQQTQPSNAPFGSTAQQTQPSNTVFGSTTQQVQSNNSAFGSTTQQTQPTQSLQNVFGITSQTTTSPPPSMFGTHMQNQSTPNIFGTLQVPNNPMPMGMFGATSSVPTQSFGAMNAPIPTFETSSIAPPQATPGSFNFGVPPSAPIFGFGQQQQQQPNQAPPQPENQPGMYGFGGPAGQSSHMQFTIGSAPNTGVRRVRKAMRRTQR